MRLTAARCHPIGPARNIAPKGGALIGYGLPIRTSEAGCDDYARR